eukprot:Protomagalhaensia_sp_Gyna_25__6111@NODE_98_length_5286_cov_144_613303_g75_i0_p4_GENE_NODE_98_length_5286_cov_144_613303_g75_i0NODE_98_length_5286_cov_144_613303_g75_i0_p4_ORF_typecomplete_len117_score1_56RNase_PH/PF01138_21/0_058_NODE_98_length_5286_cov_144_613303_g75_i024962846
MVEKNRKHPITVSRLNGSAVVSIGEAVVVGVVCNGYSTQKAISSHEGRSHIYHHVEFRESLGIGIQGYVRACSREKPLPDIKRSVVTAVWKPTFSIPITFTQSSKRRLVNVIEKDG